MKIIDNVIMAGIAGVVWSLAVLLISMAIVVIVAGIEWLIANGWITSNEEDERNLVRCPCGIQYDYTTVNHTCAWGPYRVWRTVDDSPERYEPGWQDPRKDWDKKNWAAHDRTRRPGAFDVGQNNGISGCASSDTAREQARFKDPASWSIPANKGVAKERGQSLDQVFDDPATTKAFEDAYAEGQAKKASTPVFHSDPLFHYDPRGEDFKPEDQR